MRKTNGLLKLVLVAIAIIFLSYCTTPQIAAAIQDAKLKAAIDTDNTLLITNEKLSNPRLDTIIAEVTASVTPPDLKQKLTYILTGTYQTPDGQTAVPVDVGDVGPFLLAMVKAIQDLGGLSIFMKVSVILSLLISSMKVSAVRPWWDKLGAGKPWVAPGLALLAGVFGLGAGGAVVTPAMVLTYVMAGGGAIAFHELISSLKSLPGVGPKFVQAVSILESVLGAKKPETKAQV